MESQATRRRALRPAGPLAAAVVALVLLVPLRPVVAAVSAGANRLRLAALRATVELRLRGWPRLSSPDLTVYYQPGLAADASIVAATARRDAPEVSADFGLPPTTPATLVVVSAAQLARDTGVHGTVGDYYEGVLWLLAPSAFLPAGRGLQARYERTGPVVHELTHQDDDLAAGGLPPVWFDEGLAEYEDWRLTGYVWAPPAGSFAPGTYSWAELTAPGFYRLPDQALAFRQALAAVAAVCRTGPGTCDRVLSGLRSGVGLDQALRAAIGLKALTALQSGSAWRPGTAPQPGGPAGPRP